MYNSQVVYDRIEQIMKQQNKTFGELNEKCGFNKNTVSQSAKSQDGMKARRLNAIAEFLDCSVDYLLGRTDNPQSHKSGNNVSVGDISGNSGIVGNVVSSSVNSSLSLSEQETALLNLFRSLDIITKARVIAYVADMQEGS